MNFEFKEDHFLILERAGAQYYMIFVGYRVIKSLLKGQKPNIKHKNIHTMPAKAEKLFELMVPHLEQHGPDFVQKLQAIYQFKIFVKKGDKPRVWTVDLKNGNGSIHDGEVSPSPATASNPNRPLSQTPPSS